MYWDYLRPHLPHRQGSTDYFIGCDHKGSVIHHLCKKQPPFLLTPESYEVAIARYQRSIDPAPLGILNVDTTNGLGRQGSWLKRHGPFLVDCIKKGVRQCRPVGPFIFILNVTIELGSEGPYPTRLNEFAKQLCKTFDPIGLSEETLGFKEVTTLPKCPNVWVGPFQFYKSTNGRRLRMTTLRLACTEKSVTVATQDHFRKENPPAQLTVKTLIDHLRATNKRSFSATDVAEKFSVSRPTVAAVLANMVRGKLVERTEGQTWKLL